MLDGNVLLRQKRDEVPEGTLSCLDRNLAVFRHYRHYEGLRLLPSVCEQIIIQQTLFHLFRIIALFIHNTTFYVIRAGPAHYAEPRLSPVCYCFDRKYMDFCITMY